MDSRKASLAVSVTGWTRPAPAGAGSVRRTVVHRFGGNPGLEGVTQLASAYDAAHSAALRIDIDGPSGLSRVHGQLLISDRSDIIWSPEHITALKA